MQTKMIQIKVDDETKKQFIETSKKLKLSLSSFMKLSAIEKTNKLEVNEWK